MDRKKKRNMGIVIVCALALLQSVMRLGLSASAAIGSGPALENPAPEYVEIFIDMAFAVIGVAGLATTYGLWLGRIWGHNGTILLSAATIVFDVWAVLEVQTSAMFGLVLPAVFIVYLIWRKSEFIQEVVGHEGARSIRN